MDGRLRASRFVAAGLVSLAVIFIAPFALDIRAVIRATFATQFENVLALGVAAAAGVGVLAAVRRIRTWRARRYAAIATALALAVIYARAVATGNPEVDAVERFHFVLYGLLGILFYRAWLPVEDGSVVVLPVLAGLVVSLADEWFQWFIPGRIGEVHDVILNGAALACGVLFGVGLDPPGGFALVRPGSLGRLGAFTGLVLVLLAGFLDVVHVGHRVKVSAAASFDSRYGSAQLRQLAAERTERWRRRPPPARVVRLSREDQYLSEALWHVRRRNEAWDAGDLRAAWWENRILEDFYAPVLDVPSGGSPTGHRWPPAQRADAARRHELDAQPYVSDAAPYPVRIWPRTLFRVLMALAAVGVVAVSAAFEYRRGRTR